MGRPPRESISWLAETIGRNVRLLRRSQRMSQRELADKIELSRNHLCNIELGKVRVSAEVLYDIATGLDEKMDSFFVAKGERDHK